MSRLTIFALTFAAACFRIVVVENPACPKPDVMGQILSRTGGVLKTPSSAEKAELLGRLTFDLMHTWPGIDRTPDVAGGEACIAHTRIPVWVLEGYRQLGWSEAKILENYPTLRASDLVNAWAYADTHREEIETALRKNEQA